MLQQLVQNLSSITVFQAGAPRAGQDSWLSSSFDLCHGLTVTELTAELADKLPTGFADTMPAWMPGKLSLAAA
jgi:hypothetical protein